MILRNDVKYLGGRSNYLLCRNNSTFFFDSIRAQFFFLICRRARRQRSQSPVLGTSIIDKHFELYKKLKTKRKTKEFPISFFLICRRARRQRSQSPILVTVRIDKHFKLYIDWSLSGKSKSSQLASQVMESTSTFLLIAQSAIRKASTVQSSYSRTGHHSWL